MHTELLEQLFKQTPETELAVADARERLEWIEGLREGRQAKARAAMREYREADWVAGYSRQLLRDIEARDAGRFIEMRRIEPSEQPCQSKNAQGDACKSIECVYRTVVWTANGKLTATLCTDHIKHAAHYGEAS